MTPDTHADVLRRAAKALRNPYLCNPDPAVAVGLAALFDRSACAVLNLAALRSRGELVEPHLAHLADLMETVRVARALLRSLGHSCAERPDEPCWTCGHTPAPATEGALR